MDVVRKTKNLGAVLDQGRISEYGDIFSDTSLNAGG